MATDAQGRQLSDDGYYYWDGTAWQPVQAEGGAASAEAAAAPVSFDHAFAEAMVQAGFHIDPGSVPEAAALQSGLGQALDWYQSLDAITKAAIDAATIDPGQAAIALVEAGVGTGIDSLLQAFDQVQGSLGDLLHASQQALATAEQASH